MEDYNSKDPHVYHILMSLRQLKHGKILLLGPISQSIFLDGSPWIASHAQWLKSMKVIEEYENENNFPSFKITELGFVICDLLENWYQSLKLWQKLAVRLLGGHFPIYVKRYFHIADFIFG